MIANKRSGKTFSFVSAFARSIFAIFLIAGTLEAQIDPEAGAFYFKQYLPEVYNNASPQNWAAVQDQRGVMYFGNTDGVLEYDGAHWRTIPVSNGAGVRSLAVDENGRVYVGGQGEIGYLRADSTGTLAYQSLLDKIPPEDRRFGDVWTVYATKDAVIFGSYQRVFRWSSDRDMRVWKPGKSKFGRLSLVNGVPYIQKNGEGLLEMRYNSFELAPGGELFAKEAPQAVLEYGGTLMVAVSEGFYKFDGKKFTRWTTVVDDLLKKFGLYSVAPLRNGDLAIGTLRGGLILITGKGQLDRQITKKNGIASDEVTGLYEDQVGSLWLLLTRGIAHLQMELPLTRFAEPEGLDEIVLSIQRHRGVLYAGTMTGLSRLVPTSTGTPRFEPVAGIEGQVNALVSTDEYLVAAAHGIYEVHGNWASPITTANNQIYDLSVSPSDSRLLYGVGRAGLYVLRREGSGWRQIREVPSEGQEFRTVLEDSDGRLWITTRSAIWRLTLTTEPATIERFGEAEGVPAAGWHWGYRVGNRIVFTTAKGLLQFDHELKKFVACNAFGDMFANGSRSVSLIQQSPTGDVWISGEGYNGILHHHASGSYVWDENPLARSGVKALYALYLDSNDVAWASGSDGGLVRYKVWSTSVPTTRFAAELEGVQIERGERTVFGGTGALASIPSIRHEDDALRFQFSAPYFEDETRTQYQVRLDKLDHDWSPWSAESRKEYTNLWEGNYVFHVRARDLHSRVSTEDSFAFHVLPPWYRTWWAYIIYGFALMAVMSAVVKWRLHTLAEANRKLELIIEERTEEIREQRDKIKDEEEQTEALLLNILPASVAEELRSTGTVTPLAYDDITVCFTDFVGFTLSSEGLPPAELVAALHRYFTAFDEIIDRYGLEKLKTIGDSYMFVSGLPNQSPSHAVDAVMAALEIADTVIALGDSPPGWKIRIGVHSGPVVAGVVGVRKFAFDIWGETVNFASRFESSGAANRVNISVKTYEFVREFIDCEPRGLIRIKEGRKLEMYFARGIHPELVDASSEELSLRFAKLYHERFGHPPRTTFSPKSATVLMQEASSD